MKKMLTGLTLTAMIALSLLATTSDAFAKDATHGRETAWTDRGPVPVPHGLTWQNAPVGPVGVTWE